MAMKYFYLEFVSSLKGKKKITKTNFLFHKKLTFLQSNSGSGFLVSGSRQTNLEASGLKLKH